MFRGFLQKEFLWIGTRSCLKQGKHSSLFSRSFSDEGNLFFQPCRQIVRIFEKVLDFETEDFVQNVTMDYFRQKDSSIMSLMFKYFNQVSTS
jgi:hypothetical protein